MDLIGPYAITMLSNKEISPLAMTMAYPATGWFEITEIPDKSAKTMAMKLDQNCFCCYLYPQRCIYNNGNESLEENFKRCLKAME